MQYKFEVEATTLKLYGSSIKGKIDGLDTVVGSISILGMRLKSHGLEIKHIQPLDTEDYSGHSGEDSDKGFYDRFTVSFYLLGDFKGSDDPMIETVREEIDLYLMRYNFAVDKIYIDVQPIE